MVSTTIQKFIQHKGFTALSNIQELVYPLALKGKDLIAISKTGTGKTYAYLFPVFEKIDSNLNETQVVILCPTQELTQQISDFAKELMSYYPDVRVQKALKGTSKERLDRKDHPHIVIGTLGKLKSLFIEDKIHQIDQVSCVVIDEADMMLEPKNIKELDELIGKMNPKLQTMVFSATIPDTLKAFMKSYMHHATILKAESDVLDPKIEHILIPIKEDQTKKLIQLLKNINPSLALIFVNDAKQLDTITHVLNQLKLKSIQLHGKLEARARLNLLKTIKEGVVRYVVSTDVAARGLDFEDVSDVISLGFPKDLSFYTHRAGRTGRAGKTGRVFALYSEEDDRTIRKLMDMGVKFNHQSVSLSGFKELRTYAYVHKAKPTELDKEISKLVLGRSKKVKPGYKKKLNTEIEILKRKRKRKMIQDSIKAQQKEKSIQKQREKKTG